MPLQASKNHYEELQRLSGLSVAAARRAWAGVDLADLDGSWAEQAGPRMLVAVTVAQEAAAAESASYIPAAMAEAGIPEGAQGTLRPRSLSGVASDGRPLTGLLRAPLTRVKTLVGQGHPDPLTAGRDLVDMIVQTQTMDAARVAESVSMMTQPAVSGYVRVANPPSCGRCLVLAGAFYRTRDAAGFLRHPRCDCTAEPAQNADQAMNPKQAFDSMTTAEQDRALTKAGAQAVRDGADMGRVVNARRGMSAASPSGIRTTTAGTTRRGRLPGQTRGARLMPESIYRLASDRADAVRLLRVHGYIY